MDNNKSKYELGNMWHREIKSGQGACMCVGKLLRFGL